MIQDYSYSNIENQRAFVSELALLRNQRENFSDDMSQAEETISQMKKRIIELEQKNKLNQNTILALEEQRNARGQLFDEQSRKLVDGERNKLLLELEEMKTASNKEILELRQANEDVKKALNKEIAAHNTTRENYLEQNNRAERLGQAQRQAQSEKMAADERARRNAQESMEAQSALSRLTDQMNDLQKDNQTLKMQLENTLAKTAEHEVRGETRIQLISKVRELQTEIDRVQNFKNDAILQIQSLRLERDRETERANLASSEREKQQDELRIAREGQQRITLQFRERESVLAEMQRRYEQLMEESIRMREEKEREQNAYTATLQNLQAKASEQLVSKDNIIDKLRQEIVELRKNSETTSKSKEKEFKVQNQQRIKEIKEEHNREIIQLHKIMEEKEKEYHDKEAEKKQSYEKLIFTKNEEIKRITTINEREITRLRDETKKREDELHTELQQLKEEKERERDSLIKEKQNELSEMQQRTSAECAASIQRESAVRQECEQKIRTADLQRAEEMRRNSEEERVKYETIIKDVQAQSAQAIEDAQQLKEEVEQLREVVREAEHKALMEKESALEQQRSQWTTQFQEMIEKHQSEKEDIEKEHQQREAVTQRRLTTEKKKATDALQERLEAAEKEKDQAATKLRQFEAVHGQEKRRAVSDVEKKWKDKTEAIEQKYKDELQQTQEQLKQYQKKIQELNAAQKENKQREDEMTELSEKQNTEWREALQEREQQLQRQEQRFEKEKQIQSAIHMQQLEQKDSEIRLLQDTLRRHEDQLTVGAKDREAIMSELRGNIDAERDQHERLMSQVKQQAALEQKLRDDSILQLKQQIDENHSEKDILLKQAVILRQQLDIARAQLGGVARLGLSIPSINATSTFTGYQNNSGSSDGVFNSIQENDQNQFTVNSTWFPPNSRSPSVRLSPTQSGIQMGIQSNQQQGLQSVYSLGTPYNPQSIEQAQAQTLAQMQRVAEAANSTDNSRLLYEQRLKEMENLLNELQGKPSNNEIQQRPNNFDQNNTNNIESTFDNQTTQVDQNQNSVQNTVSFEGSKGKGIKTYIQSAEQTQSVIPSQKQLKIQKQSRVEQFQYKQGNDENIKDISQLNKIEKENKSTTKLKTNRSNSSKKQRPQSANDGNISKSNIPIKDKEKNNEKIKAQEKDNKPIVRKKKKSKIDG